MLCVCPVCPSFLPMTTTPTFLEELGRRLEKDGATVGRLAAPLRLFLLVVVCSRVARAKEEVEAKCWNECLVTTTRSAGVKPWFARRVCLGERFPGG